MKNWSGGKAFLAAICASGTALFGMFGGGDPEEIQRQLAGFMEQAQQQQKVAFADQAINLAVSMTVAGP